MRGLRENARVLLTFIDRINAASANLELYSNSSTSVSPRRVISTMDFNHALRGSLATHESEASSQTPVLENFT